MATKILIVDDHPLVRQGLIGLLSTQDDFSVCGEASGIAEAQQVADAEHPDVAIIDITLEDGSGIELIKDFHVSFPDMKLLVLSMHDELVFAERALRPYLTRLATLTRPPNRKEFNDPIWGTISLEPFEILVLDSPLLQRLRSREAQMAGANAMRPRSGS